MALSSEEQSYLEKRPMKRQTFDGVNDLYLHPLYGAYTIKDCIEKEALYARQPKPKIVLHAETLVSEELMLRHEHCVDTYGCGLL